MNSSSREQTCGTHPRIGHAWRSASFAALAAAFLVTVAGPAEAKKAKANGTMAVGPLAVPAPAAPPAGPGTAELRTYTEEPNPTGGWFQNRVRVGVPAGVGVIGFAAADTICFGLLGNNCFGPSIWKEPPFLKTAVGPGGAGTTITSTSGPQLASPAIISARALARYTAAPLSLLVATSVNPGNFQRAAALAVDPFLTDVGDHSYYPEISGVELSTLFVGEESTVEFFAFDDRSSDPLWFLTISTENVLSSLDDILVTFSYDSSRLTVVDPDPGNGMSIVDEVENLVKQSFTLADDVATLSSLSPFSSTYHADSVSRLFATGLTAAATASDQGDAVPALSEWAVALLVVLLGGLSFWTSRAFEPQRT